MIALLFGDGIVGIIWILRFNTIVAKLRGDLKIRLANDYGTDFEFQVKTISLLFPSIFTLLFPFITYLKIKFCFREKPMKTRIGYSFFQSRKQSIYHATLHGTHCIEYH